jgi:hypothetical protein
MIRAFDRKGSSVATHEFRFVVSNVELDPGQIKGIGQAVVQAGTLAVADETPTEAVTVEVRPGIFWRGLPPADARGALLAHASDAVVGAE